MSARWITGDVFDGLASLPRNSVDLVLTSPPFLALRDYLDPDHPDKEQEIGREAAPAEFLDVLLRWTAECGRVLARHGSLCVELGDKHSDGDPGWPLHKSLAFVPQLYGACLAYGRNLLTGEESPSGRWRVRNNVAWVRPNPPAGALGDKYRPATSYMTVAARARDRWFDLDAVRGPHARDYSREQPSKGSREFDRNGTVSGHERKTGADPAGAPPLDWWKISPAPYSGAHYAVWPPELCRIPIDSMCPRRVCATCGAPSRREVNAERHGSEREPSPSDKAMSDTMGKRVGWATNTAGTGTTRVTAGWTSCGCEGADGLRLDGWHTGEGWRPGLVLDPFAGSGTTLSVATGMSRDAIGIDLDPRNEDLARERVGMFLETTPSNTSNA